jgi:hypothetical protein
MITIELTLKISITKSLVIFTGNIVIRYKKGKLLEKISV